MAETSNFFPMTPSTTPSSAKTMIDAWDSRNDDFANFFEIEQTNSLGHTLILQNSESENTKPDCDKSLTSDIDFGPESYVTPRRSVRSCASYLNPPPPPQGNDCSDIFKCKKQEQKAHQMSSIMIPSIGCNTADPSLSSKLPLFKLLPRKKRSCNTQSCLSLKSTHIGEPRLSFHHSSIDFKSKLESQIPQPQIFFCNNGPLLEPLQTSAIKSKCMERSPSFTALSA